jgi:hypothetical protein
METLLVFPKLTISLGRTRIYAIDSLIEDNYIISRKEFVLSR